jgi:hypothetical protein
MGVEKLDFSSVHLVFLWDPATLDTQLHLFCAKLTQDIHDFVASAICRTKPNSYKRVTLIYHSYKLFLPALFFRHPLD